MLWRTRKQLDPEADHETRVNEVLDFQYPSWVLDHHRHNLITKISKSETSWFKLLVRRSFRGYENSNDHVERLGFDNNLGLTPDRTLPAFRNRQAEGVPSHQHIDRIDQSYRINISELQRLRLRQLQQRLVQHTVDLRYDAMEPSGWTEDLRQYVQALQDYDYMGTHIFQPHDPFIVTGERVVDRCMLHVAMRDKENEADPLRWANSTANWETNDISPEPIRGTRDTSARRAWINGFRKRLGVAAIGGIFLIAPMWLMVLHRMLYTALISTTIFVAVFGLVMALFLDRLQDVMSSTAAYSAVLVVFVGLTIPSNNP